VVSAGAVGDVGAVDVAVVAVICHRIIALPIGVRARVRARGGGGGGPPLREGWGVGSPKKGGGPVGM
jgi:hypothetical protein